MFDHLALAEAEQHPVPAAPIEQLPEGLIADEL